MIAIATTSAFFTVASLPPESCSKIGRVPTTIGAWGIKSKSGSTSSLKVKGNAQTPSEVNRTKDGLVFHQNFSIRSYEIGPNRVAFIETLMNYLQETKINHLKTAGFVHGFCLSPEMCKKNLIWVVTKIQVLVDRYPTWGDVVQVDTWIAASGKNGMRRDWLVCDCTTGDVLIRASSQWVLMNKETRRLTKFPDNIRVGLSRYFLDLPPIMDVDNKKLLKLDESTTNYIHTGLIPRWSDFDAQQHVSNVKYISLILASTPLRILESHEIFSMTLEYRRECGRDSVLQSLTTVSSDGNDGLIESDCVQCQHLLRLKSGTEIMRAKTKWKPKFVDNLGTLGQ